jgi:hypothetical protein
LRIYALLSDAKISKITESPTCFPNYLRIYASFSEIKQGKTSKPIALTAFALQPDSEDYDECVRRKWFYVRNGYVDQKIPYPSNECHRYDIYMNGFGISYIELMAMLDKVNMLFNSLVCYGRINLPKPI